MRIYLARPNNLPDLNFQRAKKILKQDFPNPHIIYHNKLKGYDPNLILTADLVVFITKNDEVNVGKGLASQIKQCKESNIQHISLIVGNIGYSLVDRGYYTINDLLINDPNAYDENHGEFQFGRHIDVDSLSKFYPENITDNISGNKKLLL
ncbi:MAG: hypothetical protein ACW97V_18140 [Promethearchaeota archaeon]|jgi:hypothetical protein